MRITWGTAILALAVTAGAYTTTSIVGAQAPLTQEGFPAAMKTVASTAGSVRTKLMMNQLPDAAKDLQTLATTFGDVEKFFASKNKSDAVMWAQTARAAATAAAGAATAGDAMKATTEVGNLQATCKQCHGAYREQVPGSQPPTYQFKAGAI